MLEQTILVTGGCGFIGSNFIPYFLEKYEEYKIVNIDKLTYAGSEVNLSSVKNHPRYKFIKGDICNKEFIEFIFEEFNITSVIHFAAESHVDNSIASPGAFIQTNIVGTFNLLEVARKQWMKEPHQVYAGCESNRFHHISTDEVFGSLGEEGFFTEETSYAPNSPYSSSKASSDFIVRSFYHTYGLNVVTTNCSNNYGPKQHREKLVPTIIHKAMSWEPIPIYGDGNNVRDWLYVLDHCVAIDTVFHKGSSGETYNIGGHNEKTNIYIVTMICEILDNLVPNTNGSYKELITYVRDRPGHDRRYAIDASKIQKELGWLPLETFQTGILKTVEWYLNVK
jgi:dTDP-glucose 4,6-dehydratase